MYHLYKSKSVTFLFININVTQVPTVIELLNIYSKRKFDIIWNFWKIWNHLKFDISDYWNKLYISLYRKYIETSFTSLYIESMFIVLIVLDKFHVPSWNTSFLIRTTVIFSYWICFQWKHATNLPWHIRACYNRWYKKKQP